MIFELDNIELSFKNKRILNGIYIKSETGKITGVLGRNGSGKSSLLQIWFGSLKPKYKLVRVDQQPIIKPFFETGMVSYLPQHHLTPNGLKVKSAFKLYDVNFDEFLSYFNGLNHSYNQRFSKLSGGERRLIETFLIIKKQGQIILLDEPFSHLAPVYIETLNQLLQKEKQHKAIVITDHMYRHIIENSDDIYLINNGASKHINNLTELEDYKYLSMGML